MRLCELTQAQRLAICNGVGPQFAQMLFRPLWRAWQGWQPNEEFYWVACQHDLDYWVGGGLCEKWAADDRFIAGCMEIAVQHRGWRKFALTLLAQTYGLAVKSLLGWLAWHYGRQRTYADLKGLDA